MTRGLPDDGRLDRAEPLANPTRSTKGDVMRTTLRRTVAGGLMLTCAALLGATGVTTADSDEEAFVAAASAGASETGVFAGRTHYGEEVAGGRTLYGDGVTYRIGQVWEGRYDDMDDPRLNGAWRTVLNRMGYRDTAHQPVGKVWTAASRIDNEEGSWIGTVNGYEKPIADFSPMWYQQGLYAGSGAYDGLSALIFHIDTRNGYDTHGIVFPGEMPPLPDVPEPAE